MKRSLLLIAAVVFGAQAAAAADTLSGSGALALAGLVGEHAPNLSASEKSILAAMLNGDLNVSGSGTITVHADSVTCRASDVDISAHDCTLKFGSQSRTFKGRAAHELFATLIENGVPSDGAAGSIFESVTNLACSIDVAEVKSRGGGGASCTVAAMPGS